MSLEISHKVQEQIIILLSMLFAKSTTFVDASEMEETINTLNNSIQKINGTIRYLETLQYSSQYFPYFFRHFFSSL